MLKPTRNKRRIAALAGALALSTCLALGLAGCANSEGNGAAEPTAPATEQEANADAQAATEAESGAITFTDDLGRTVELPAQIDKICPSGFTAQQVLLTMAPDKMVGLAQELNDDQLKIFGEKFANYPVFGAVLGAKDDLNREAVAAAARVAVGGRGVFEAVARRHCGLPRRGRDRVRGLVRSKADARHFYAVCKCICILTGSHCHSLPYFRIARRLRRSCA